MRSRFPFGLFALAFICVAGFAVGMIASRSPSTEKRAALAAAELNVTTVTTTYDLDTQYVGKCGIVTPPAPDHCDSAQGALRYHFFAALVNADNFKKWKSSSPGDYQRLTAHMQAPQCSAAPVGLAQDMKTPLGAALFNVVQAYACALGTEPIAWPTPNPAPTGSDKTPPTAPGPITVSPSG